MRNGGGRDVRDVREETGQARPIKMKHGRAGQSRAGIHYI